MITQPGILNSCIITIDIDWAPDFAIDKMAAVLIEKNVKATWFVTHDSPAIDRLKSRNDLFELGVHPNFLPNSTQGKTVKEVMDFCFNITPAAVSMRTHTLLQSGGLYWEIVENYPIKIDTSILLRENDNIQPHTIFYGNEKNKLIRVPFFWEDDVESYNPGKIWSIDHLALGADGIKIFNFHPMYFLLNIDTMDDYEALKKLKHLYQLTDEDVSAYINRGRGAGTVFDEITSHIQKTQNQSFFMKDFISHG